jgi:hypothetical protein
LRSVADNKQQSMPSPAVVFSDFVLSLTRKVANHRDVTFVDDL